jgi:hypothetical protein
MAAPPNTFRVYDKVARQERFLTPSEYCARYGYTRQERADTLWLESNQRTNDFLSRRRLCIVISQTQPIPTKHTVYFDASRRAVSCTCDDFRNNTLQNDDFMCKHMILYEDHKNSIRV